jgi:hypothetical protein
MELFREKVVKKVVTLIESPTITAELQTDSELGVSFYTIYLSFVNILDAKLFRKEMSFILKGAEVEDIFTNKKLKLEDVFAKYINDKDGENEETRLEAEKIANAYVQLIKAEKRFV